MTGGVSYLSTIDSAKNGFISTTVFSGLTDIGALLVQDINADGMVEVIVSGKKDGIAAVDIGSLTTGGFTFQETISPFPGYSGRLNLSWLDYDQDGDADIVLGAEDMEGRVKVIREKGQIITQWIPTILGAQVRLIRHW